MKTITLRGGSDDGWTLEVGDEIERVRAVNVIGEVRAPDGTSLSCERIDRVIYTPSEQPGVWTMSPDNLPED